MILHLEVCTCHNRINTDSANQQRTNIFMVQAHHFQWLSGSTHYFTSAYYSLLTAIAGTRAIKCVAKKIETKQDAAN